ncbi:hybrid sensor histidine kinase/response regulator [Comamonas composti]|uniref:hybrid sensor histidine kinase/response regulator n=1 Tax=Comamonas composti TaxID=408558 RepID=UPI0003FE3085|nr:Hpt domain-containing protein [Comamonas composti]
MSVVEDLQMGAAQTAQTEQDLGPLAWVLDELRKSLEGAGKAVRRFVRDAEVARVSDLDSLDTSALRIARQQLHQAFGALQMVGLEAPARLLQAMENAVNRFVQRPELCLDESVSSLERASFALIEYLEALLAGRQASAVALFPQYREIQALAGDDKAHPVDLWTQERELAEPDWAEDVAQPLEYGSAARALLDGVVLRLVKGEPGSEAAAQMRDLCLRLAAGQPQDGAVRSFWKLAAGFFDAQASGLIVSDLFVKRMASRVLMQYAAMAKGGSEPPSRLQQELLFFCLQAQPREKAGPVLQMVLQAYGQPSQPQADYKVERFGRYDPSVLALARKRVAAVAETWSAVAGGDRSRLRLVGEQFNQVGESLVKLHPASHKLASMLIKVGETVTKAGEPPPAELAMEVATAVLYLQATFASMDLEDHVLASQAACLAQRLEESLQGQPARPLEPWMEELYRQSSEHQTMGSVVGELRATLGEAEKHLDQYFRAPDDASVLAPVSGQMAQMRGVLSVLGLEQAAQAMQRMRDTVEHLVLGEVADSNKSRVFEKLGNSLGAMGFLIDMLSYQRSMARKLFVYDEAEGELRILMGRSGVAAQQVQEASSQSAAAIEAVLPAEPVTALMEPQEPASPPAVPPAPPAQSLDLDLSDDDSDEELLSIFLEEAREVVETGLQALRALAEEPGNLSEQTTLRRAFHTLKGSSRMVGLDEFGEAGWAMEQMLNAWLATQKPMPQDMQDLAARALKAFADWADAIEHKQAEDWLATPFRAAADAMRLEGQSLDLPLAPVPGRRAELVAEAAELPSEEAESEAETAAEPVPESQVQVEDLDLGELLPEIPQTGDEPQLAEPLELTSDEIDLGWSLDLDLSDEAAAQSLELAPETASEPGQESAPEQAAVQEIDFAAFEQALQELQPLQPAAQAGPSEQDDAEAQPLETSEETLELDFKELGLDLDLSAVAEPQAFAQASAEAGEPEAMRVVQEPESELVSESEPAAEEAHIKIVDGLRISMALYNVYLNEADDWSRRLDLTLEQWAKEPATDMPGDAFALAHSLAGSSATVGFAALSNLARLLEHALAHLQQLGRVQPAQIADCLAASGEIRRLLHQFAAGFLKTPLPGVEDGLRAILAVDADEVEVLPEPEQQLPEPEQQLPEPAAEVQAQVDAADAALVPTAPPAYSALARQVDPQQEVELQKRIDEAIAHAMALGSDADDDIEALDEVDPDLFPIFEEEAVELLPRLGAALRRWHGRPSLDDARNEVLRALHTLKGSARLAGAMRLGEMAHRLESAVEQVDSHAPTGEAIEPLLGRFDALQAGFDLLRLVGEQEPSGNWGEASMPQAPAVQEPVESAQPASAQADAEPGQEPAFVPPPAPLAPVLRPAMAHTVRVRAQLLDRLISQSGEVLIARSRVDARLVQARSSLQELGGNLERLRGQLRDIEVQAESQMQSRLALSKDTAAGFDPLEFDRFTRVQELTRMMAESVNDVATVQRNLQRDLSGAEDDLVAQGRQARDLQRDLLRTRMVEFDSLAERLYAVVRQTSKEMGKQVRLNIRGGSIEMDRGMLERMLPAFEHLLRNSVAHGIEQPEQRQALGKPQVGNIEIILSQERNDVALSIEDDGEGLNVERIRAKAVSQGLWPEDKALEAEDAGRLIFEPGFTTATEVTGVAGRGIGMDVVRSEVNALGGRIETHSEAGRGSAFRLVLPLTTAVTQVVLLRVGPMIVGVPASLIEIVRRATLQTLGEAYASHAFEDGQESLPFYWAGALWQGAQRSEEGAGRTRPVVIVRSAAQRIALHVDEVLGNQEVVVKNLGPQLARLPGLSGMSVLPSGAVVQIYNPVALANVYGDEVRARLAALEQAEARDGGAAAQAAKAAPTSVPLVLVVDDSITVRRVTQRLLQREGYRVSLAADGLQALEKLQDERPTLVLSDIEMPRMDGFDLLRNIRADEGLKHLPVVMITSRIAQKHRDMARELGADHYLGKPYSDEELLGLIQHYALQGTQVES